MVLKQIECDGIMLLVLSMFIYFLNEVLKNETFIIDEIRF